ncbi:MAG: hypothetical protein R3245_02520 [Kiloniellales bacterium]|nr:hypothetical protein [Kiloniellales bacterium]
MNRSSLPAFACIAAASIFLFLAACSYRHQIDNPVTWKLTWYSYIDGEDIRGSCVPGAPLHYRFIYNADYERHVRSYTFIDDDQGGAYVISRATTGSGIDITAFSFEDPFAIGGKWARSERRLSPAELAAFRKSLTASGAFQEPDVGLRVYSNQYYWVAALCDEGRFYFNAWLYPSPAFERFEIPKALYAFDETSVVPPEPIRVPSAARIRGDRRGEKPNSVFEMRVGEEGFVGGPLL